MHAPENSPRTRRALRPARTLAPCRLRKHLCRTPRAALGCVLPVPPTTGLRPTLRCRRGGARTVGGVGRSFSIVRERSHREEARWGKRMNAIGASTDAVSAHDGTRQREAAIRRCAAGSEPMPGEMQLAMGDIDFSRVNLQYLICARDLARDYPERAAVLLGVPDALGPAVGRARAPTALAAVTAIKAPLLIPRQEPWWWERLFTALQAGRPEELRAVLQQAGLLVATAGPSGDRRHERHSRSQPPVGKGRRSSVANACDADLCIADAGQRRRPSASRGSAPAPAWSPSSRGWRRPSPTVSIASCTADPRRRGSCRSRTPGT